MEGHLIRYLRFIRSIRAAYKLNFTQLLSLLFRVELSESIVVYSSKVEQYNKGK